MYTHTHTHTHTHIYIYIYTYLYTHTHTHKIHVWCLILAVTHQLQSNSPAGIQRTPEEQQQYNTVYKTTVYTRYVVHRQSFHSYNIDKPSTIFIFSPKCIHILHSVPIFALALLHAFFHAETHAIKLRLSSSFSQIKPSLNPSVNPTFSKPVPTCLAIKEPRSCRSANRQPK